MINVTDNAKRELKRILDAKSLSDNQTLLLSIPPMWTGDGDFGIVIGDKDIEGIVIESEEYPVLLIDTQLADRLDNSVLDFKGTPEGSRFTLDVF